ncbi:hypothetical protein AYK25_05755 [Thermoplasmatales archaeon SM1-50]|nr:MAG: hypothetical protein AYK25_05755 [Thermoplasmatales archaeon SM1-50]
MLFKNHDELVLNGGTPLLQQKRRDVLEMLAAAVNAVDPYRVVHELFEGSQLVFPSEIIDLSSFDHIYLVGLGKASAGMAQAVCDVVQVIKGVIITNDSSATITSDSIEVVVGGHPLPNTGSISGAEKILHLFRQCSENDCVVVVISGGGSSLFCKPRIPLSDFQTIVNLLLRSGATIDELNTIRKHLSLVKGGQLVQQTNATVLSLIISDVINDPLSSIASGPTSPDPTTFSDAKEILHRYRLWETIPGVVRNVLEKGLKGYLPETPKQDDSAFERVFNFIIANNEHACQGALHKAREIGYAGELLTTSMTGEARILGKDMISRVKQRLSEEKTAFISGGEPTVTVLGDGIGGRNQEFVLGCVEEIAGSNILVASFATDGIDGNSRAAGALCDGLTFARALKKNLHPNYFFKQSNSFVFFDKLGDALLTGVTGTNVMDIQIMLL